MSESSTPKVVRCGIYTRKSTEEGLEQSFNSLHAQREAAEAYVLSQKQAGWVVVPEQYEDGGYTGANLERPGLQRLLVDVEAGAIDCVLVYKVDRLTRSLLDFARLMERFDRSGVSFASVTQEFHTTSSLGRLTLHILLSFAQFEREIIGERTRDKLSAARRKGKWIGGWAVLGYDLEAGGGRLLVNPQEAAQVGEIFAIAAEAGTLEGALESVQRAGYQTKGWRSRKGVEHPSRPFTRNTLRRVLTNVLYTGSVSLRGIRYAGEQERIVAQELWERVNQRLEEGGRLREGKKHKSQKAALTGLLYCGACGYRMLPTYTRRGKRAYHYYSCEIARRSSQATCGQPPVGASDMETELIQKLQEMMGGQEGKGWSALQESIERITLEGESGETAVRLRDGTGFTFRLAGAERRLENGRVKRRRVEGRVPRISRLLALAIRFRGLLREGKVKKQVEIARAGKVSRARMTQIMRLTELAPDIQEELLFLPKTVRGRDCVTEKALRRIAGTIDWEEQRKQLGKLMDGSRKVGAGVNTGGSRRTPDISVRNRSMASSEAFGAGS